MSNLCTTSEKPSRDARATGWGLMILSAMQGRQMFLGSDEPWESKQRRRAANRVARRRRKANRRAGVAR